ncbi:uncharacterized protein LOC142317599 [Lycorma delicatula]|uniref:uncharacterized protein LOC142317599 n=1 Tax=Lycorma delicatula TaxID=130591 RepID=UPI003F510EF4
MLKTLLVNVNRSQLLHDLVSELVRELKIDFLMVTEPNVYVAARTGWMADTGGDVAFTDVSGRIAWRFANRGKCYIVLETDFAIVIGAFVSPNCDFCEFTIFIDNIHRVVTSTSKRMILIGDFNCKSVMTGSNYNNRRGELLAEFMEITGCHCVNDSTVTFEARGHSSVLDLTILDNRWNNEQWSWGVLSNDIASDHYATYLNINDPEFRVNEKPPLPRITSDQISEIVENTVTKFVNLENRTPEALTNIIHHEMDRVGRKGARKFSVYWWTEEIKCLR